MGPLNLFELGLRHNRWLSQRLSLVAGNVANANTPEFKSKDIAPFNATLDAMAQPLRATSAMHVSEASPIPRSSSIEEAEAGETHHSGNSVNLDQEFMKAGEISRSMSLNVGLMKAFHRMLSVSVRS
jgi:flagellar basal-body rod protein FlgB